MFFLKIPYNSIVPAFFFFVKADTKKLDIAQQNP